MTRHVLVTGGAGFLGTHLAAALRARGDEVTVLDCMDPQIHGEVHGRPAWLPEGTAFVRGDVADPPAVRGALRDVTHVVHLAARTGTGQSMTDVAAYVRTNVLGTAVLLEEAVARGGARLRGVVLASSRAVYGEGAYRCGSCGIVRPAPRAASALAAGRWDPPCPRCGGPATAVGATEDLPPCPGSVYGVTKAQQEALLDAVSRAYGLPGAALRFQNVYGEGQSMTNPYTGVLPAFLDRARAGGPIPLYEDGRATRDFVHVSDAVEGMLLALDRCAVPPVVCNIGTGEPATLERVARAIARGLKVEVPLARTGTYRVGDIRHAFADLTRARRDLGFAPRVPLEEGIARFVAWARDRAGAGAALARSERELADRGLLGRGPAGGGPS